ncbi:hypothetical protein [Aquimarina muelleri]|uniref:Uncharacterized protein n=1 Tax=Aquimarina muelleri TaxID=279356 RepID=A0A918N3T6_9FLAO|nr:hypothetical protein [Aquimarina muelleri]MCX2761511.1 hypothetical protein [Aquimarina muelleri]GGX14257.1 hypothetical protein GCM10007384_14840 [Aquimarina muelleri]
MSVSDENKIKLEYSVMPAQVYYTRDASNPSKAVLTIGVSNTTDSDIDLAGFEIALPVNVDETDANALTSDPSSITPVSFQPTKWDFQNFSDATFRSSPIAPVTGLKAGESITFQLQGITVNEAKGTALLTITENAGNDFPTLEKQVTKIASDLDITLYSANPVEINSGAISKLSWATNAAARVTLLPGDFSSIKVNDSVDVTPGITTTYTLTAYGEGPNISKQVTIQISPPEIVNFDSNEKMVNAGDTITLLWDVKYADTIAISPGNYNDLSAEGTKDVQIWENTTFIITATNKGNQTSVKTVPITINPVSITNFKATPDYGARLGESIELSWDVKSAVSASIQYGTIHKVEQNNLADGRLTIVPNTGIAYSLIAQNALGSEMTSLQLLPLPLGWYKATSNAPFQFSEPPLVLKYKNNMWAMASNLMNSVYYSFDGVSWLPATNATAWQPRSYSAGIIFKNKMWLMGGQIPGGANCLNDVWSSEDGITWAQETGTAAWPARRSFGCFVLPGADKIFIVGGIDATGNCLKDVWSSIDGKTWVNETEQAFEKGRGAFGITVYNNEAYILGGLTGGDEKNGTPTNDVWYSTNGKQWSLLRVNWQARYYPAVAALSNGLYLSGGIGKDGKGINDLNMMNNSKRWSARSGISNIKGASGLEYQNSLWCIGGGTNSEGTNKDIWAYSPATN